MKKNFFFQKLWSTFKYQKNFFIENNKNLKRALKKIDYINQIN